MKTLEERFWLKVDRRSVDACWPWLASKDAAGYGNFSRTPVGPYKRVTKAHRIAYELLVGSIPTGLTIDHLCRNTSCVNPAHMEPVTLQENMRRGNCISTQYARRTHCKRGHALTPENMMIWGANTKNPGKRACRLCKNLKSAESKRRRRRQNKITK